MLGGICLSSNGLLEGDAKVGGAGKPAGPETTLPDLEGSGVGTVLQNNMFTQMVV